MPSKDRNVKNKTNLDYYYRNKEKILEKARLKSKEFYAKNKDILLTRTKKYRENNYEASMFSNLKSRCKTRNIEITIDISDIVIPEFCPYLGCKLTTIQGQGRVWSNASIDRINPSKGYVKGNIQVISMKANVMKSHATEEELIIFAENILKLHK